MEEDKPFDDFYAKLKDIVNSAFNLGETIPKPKIVRKVLRSEEHTSELQSRLNIAYAVFCLNLGQICMSSTLDLETQFLEVLNTS